MLTRVVRYDMPAPDSPEKRENAGQRRPVRFDRPDLGLLLRPFGIVEEALGVGVNRL